MLTQFRAVLICVTVVCSFENSHPLWLQLISQACWWKWAATPVRITALVCCKHRTGSWTWTPWPLPGPGGLTYTKFNVQKKQFVAYPGQLIRAVQLIKASHCGES